MEFAERVLQLKESKTVKTDYRIYIPPGKELFRFVAEGAVMAALVDLLFYKSAIMYPVLLTAVPWWVKFRKKERQKARIMKLCFDFKEFLNAIAVSVRAGYSVENAFIEAEDDLRTLLGNTDFVRELASINARMRVSVPVEQLLGEFAGRTGAEDIENFAAVFSSAKRMGGNMGDIIADAAGVIEEKIDVEREIEAALAAKRMEQRIMGVMPCGIIIYMQLASPGFLSVLYDTLAGHIIMTACLAGYAGALYWGMRIVSIEV